MKHLLSRCAASPSLAAREGDDTVAAGRPLLGVRSSRCASCMRIKAVESDVVAHWLKRVGAL